MGAAHPPKCCTSSRLQPLSKASLYAPSPTLNEWLVMKGKLRRLQSSFKFSLNVAFENECETFHRWSIVKFSSGYVINTGQQQQQILVSIGCCRIRCGSHRAINQSINQSNQSINFSFLASFPPSSFDKQMNNNSCRESMRTLLYRMRKTLNLTN